MILWAFKMVVVVAGMVLLAQALGIFDRSGEALIGTGVDAPQPRLVSDGGAGGTREMHIPMHDSGHFIVPVSINGTEIDFLVDTGASQIMLREQDARRIGLELEWLEYSETFMTANGAVKAAPVRLDTLRLGEIEIYDIGANVNGGEMSISLLGMTFLEHLEGYEVRNGTLVLRW